MAVVAVVVGCADNGSSESDAGSTSDATMTTMTMPDDSSSSSMPNDPETSGDSAESGGDVSSEGGASSSSSSEDGTDGGTTGGALSFEQDVWPVLAMDRDPPLTQGSASCAACHGGGAGGLALPDAAGSYANLIDVPSTSALCAGTPRVTAGDPDGSCFVIFYEMRLRDSLGWVDETETELVRAWVASGAAP